MRRDLSIFGAGLAVGAIASLLFTASAQFPAGRPRFQPAPAKASVQKSLPLEHLIGIAQFVKNPTDYKLAYGKATWQVTGASLEGDRTTISYLYLDADGLETDSDKSGILVGTLDSQGIFKGVFQASHESEISTAGAAFMFHADGTAKAIDSEAAAQILL